MNQIVKLIIPAMLLPVFLHGQTIEWERVFSTSASNEEISGITVLVNNEILAIGSKSLGMGIYQPTVCKLDSQGNLIWLKHNIYDSTGFGTISFIKDIPDKPNQFYISLNRIDSQGYVFEQVIMRIDTTLDTLWTKPYLFAFSSTIQEAIVLRDQSIVTVGSQITSSGYDIITRRIDSVGNLIWESIYNQPGAQIGLDITEMLDGSLVINSNSTNNLQFVRIGFDGKYIESSLSNIIGSTVSSSNVVDSLNRIFGINFSQNNGPEGNFYIIDESLGVVHTHKTGPGLDNISINKSQNYLIEKYNNNYTQSGFEKRSFPSVVIDSFLTQPDTLFIDTYSWFREKNNLFISGSKGTSQNKNFWLAKINGVGEEWIPDRCAYQPPQAGFEYEYNYPILTLRDTSSGGLKYLDTIYTWQWNTSNGMSGTDDSLLVFFDTANSNTLDVQLIVSNWYECIDTVNITLDFTPSGISVEKELECRVYPNPVSDVIHIELSEGIDEKVLFEIFDLHGTKVKSETFNSRHLRSKVHGLSSNVHGLSSNVHGLSSNVHGLSSGMYFYRISSGSQIQRGKIVKQ